MSDIKIVCDSTSDIPQQLVKKYDIGVIPANVIFEDEMISHYNITNDQFYTRLIEGASPTTGVPAPKVFQDVFDKNLESSSELIVLTLSKKLSGMYSSAKMITNEYYDETVTIIDTEAVTLQMAIIVVEAAMKAQSGASKDEILNFVTKTLIPKSQLLGIVDSLKYLRRGGRVNTITWLLGSLLSVKPILRIEDGLLVSHGRVRGSDHALEVLQNVIRKATETRVLETIMLGHSHDPEKGKILKDYFLDLPNAPQDVLLAEIGPVCGTHLGPGALGIAWFGNYQKEWL
ncbi:MAG: DegV family protein [Candidatus Heimdallarchaeota archaeon]